MKSKYLILFVLIFLAVAVSAQKVLPVSEAIELALENNYGIKIVDNNKKIAENNASLLNSGYLPTITGNAGGSIDRQNTEGIIATTGESRIARGAETRRYNASVNLNYTLFDGLGRYYDYKRLKEEYKLSELQARETIENTISQLYTVYYNVAQVYENVQTLEQTLAISKDRITRAKYQFEYGQSTKLDILNAQVDINNDSINLINAKQQLINTKRDLNVVLGNILDGDFSVETTIGFLLSIDKEDMLKKMKDNNVTLLQVENNIKINQFLIKANKSGFLPSVGLTGSYGWNEIANNSPLAFITQNTTSGLSGAVNLTWNIFDGGGTVTRVKNAKINLQNQEYEKQSLLISVERDFYNAWDDYQNRLAVYQVQENNIVTAKNNFDRTQEKYKLGQVTSIEFRQAQLNLLSAELSRNQAKYQAKLAELSVLQLSGELLNVKF